VNLIIDVFFVHRLQTVIIYQSAVFSVPLGGFHALIAFHCVFQSFRVADQTHQAPDPSWCVGLPKNRNPTWLDLAPSYLYINIDYISQIAPMHTNKL